MLRDAPLAEEGRGEACTTACAAEADSGEAEERAASVGYGAEGEATFVAAEPPIAVLASRPAVDRLVSANVLTALGKSRPLTAAEIGDGAADAVATDKSCARGSACGSGGDGDACEGPPRGTARR